MNKPRLSFWQIWNMSFGFLGIQFGWGLQMANMSAIYEYLGAKPEQIAKLWIAAPLTGLLVQPIIGAMSDRTWTRLGRRRPYFLVGAVLSSIALVLMPNSGALAEWLMPHYAKFWMAAGLLWVLDASINISMEPFRAFVADKLPAEQRSSGFAMQSLFIGLGAVVAGALPWMLSNWFGVKADPAATGVPVTVRLAFYVGAAVFFGAVLWTVCSSREYPPEDLAAFERMKAGHGGFGATLREIGSALQGMPPTMKQLAAVQLFTWLGLFCMWLYFTPTVARHVFGASDPQSDLYKRGNEWAGICYALKDFVTFAFAFALVALAKRFDRRHIHGAALVCGGLGLIGVAFVHGESNKHWLLVCLGLGGIAWASILSMPYAILSGALPVTRIGVYMGIFNFFIVIPEIIASLVFDGLMKSVFGGQQFRAVVTGGVCLLVAAILTQFVREPVHGADEQLQDMLAADEPIPTATPPENPLS